MERNCDGQGRWRSRTIGFRVSEEEGRLIDALAELSGLSKQEYITRRLQYRDVVVQGNPRVYKALRNRMDNIYGELKRITSTEEISLELLYTIQVVAQTMDGMKEGGEGYED